MLTPREHAILLVGARIGANLYDQSQSEKLPVIWTAVYAKEANISNKFDLEVQKEVMSDGFISGITDKLRKAWKKIYGN